MKRKSVLDLLFACSARLAVFVLAVCVAGSAWAATWSHAGYVSVDSANPTAVFTGVSLADLGTKLSVNASMGGGWVATKGLATTYSYTTGENKLTVEFRKIDGDSDKYCKAVYVDFTEATADNVTTIYAVATSTKAKKSTDINADLSNVDTGTPASSASANGYGIYGLYLAPIDSTITRVAAPKVAYNENFPSSQTTVTTRGESITVYPANGASVSDGVITLSADGSTGPAFAIPASGYVSVILKADFTGVTLAADQILFGFGNGSDDFLTGAYLTSSGESLYATAFWQGNNWTTADDSSNTISLTGEQTLLVTYDKSDGTYKGNHLYVLQDGVAVPLYGTSSGNTLKGGDVTKVFIGGGFGSWDGKSNLSGLVISEMALYTSNTALPVTPDTFAAFPDIFPACVNSMTTVADGATTSISALNTAAPCVVTVAPGATVNIDATPADNVYFTDESAFAMDGYGRLWKYDVTANLKNGGKARLPYTDVSTTLASIEDGGALVLTGDTDNTGSLAVTLPTGANGANINATIIRKDGGYCTGTWDGDNNAYTYTSTINTSICGSSTLVDYTYTNTTVKAAGSDSSRDLDVSPGTFNNTLADKTTGLMLKHRPWMNIADNTFSGNSAAMSVAVVGTMSPTANTIFLHVGNCGDSKGGLLICTGTTKDSVNIYWNVGTALTLLTSMSVPNSATARHVYVVTKEDDETSTTFNIWLDGKLWKSYNDGSKYSLTTGGIQVGADHGGKIRNLADGNANKRNVVNNLATETGYVNLIRYFGKVLTEAEIKAFSANEEYPYTSPNGNSRRTFSADGTWATDGEDWETTTAAGVVSNVGAPLNGSALTVTGDGGTAETPTEISVNLDSTTTYEAINISGDPVAFDLADGKTGTIRVTGAVEVGTAVKIKKGALSIEGPITFLQGGSVDFDYSEYDASGITTETQIILATGLENADGITCSDPQTPYKTYSAAYNSSSKDYILTITPQVATIGSTGYTSFAAALDAAQAGDTIQINQDIAVDSLALDKNVTIRLGAEYITGTETPFTFTVGSFSGEGALALTGTGTLKIPVGATIPNLTFSGSAKIAVTGTVAKGTTLFTITSGTYANERVGTDTYGDVHYTATDGAYVVGKTYYWKNSSTNNSTSGSPNNYLNNRTASWSTESPTGATASDIPLAYDTAIFNKSGARALVNSSLPCNIKILADFSFLDKDKNNEHILGADDLTIEIADGATMYLAVEAASFSNVIKPKGKLVGGETARVVASPAAGNSSIKFAWDASEYKGSIDIRIGSERNTQALFETDGSLDNSFARWYVSTNGTYSFRSGYTGRTTFSKHDFSKIYKFGSLQAYLSCDDKNGADTYRLAFELGKNVDEDSWLRNKWYKKTADHGGKIFWWAPTATFTNEIVNSYQVDLCGGGNVYIPASATENAAAEYVPTQLNFTDNGGYLLFDDDNVSIGGSILAAVNTKTAGVGLNAATDEAIAVTAGVLSGTDFKKKGAGKITLTGAFTDLGTVAVEPDAGALVFKTTTQLTKDAAENGYVCGIYTKCVETTEEGDDTTYVYTFSSDYVASYNDVQYVSVAFAMEAAGDVANYGDIKVLSATAEIPAGWDLVAAGSGDYWTLVDKRTATWKGETGAWGTAANWTEGYVPLAGTAVTFPAGEYTVYIDSANCVGGAMTVNGTVTLAQTGDSTTVHNKISIYGGIAGSGTLKLHHAGLNNASGANQTISANIEVLKPEADENSDSWFEGAAFTFSGTLTGTGKICSYSQHVFTGTVNVNGVEFYASEDQHITGGTVNVNSGKLQVGLSNKAKWIKASENAVFNLNGGLLNLCRITAVGPYTLNFNGGTLGSYGAGSSNGMIIGGDSADGSNVITVNVSANSTITNATDTAIAPVLNDASDNASPVITKTGAGKLTLSATPAATIGFSLAGGSLVIPTAYEGTVSSAVPGYKATGTADTDTGMTTYTLELDTVTVTVPTAANMTLNSVTASLDGYDGSAIIGDPSEGVYTVLRGAMVTVTYTPGTEYSLENDGVVTLTASGDSTTVTTPAISNKATTYTWAAEESVAWATLDNWKVGDAAATRLPTSIDTVVFNDGATVSYSAHVSCGAMVVNGAVTITGAENKDIQLYGNVTGEGTITLNSASLKNMASSGIAVAPQVRFTGTSALAGANGVTLNGDVTFVANAVIKPWDGTHAISGNATFEGAFGGTGNGNGALVFGGQVTINNALTVNGSSIGMSSTATVILANTTATLTDSRETKIDISKVSTTVTGASVKLEGNVFSVVENSGIPADGKGAEITAESLEAAQTAAQALDVALTADATTAGVTQTTWNGYFTKSAYEDGGKYYAKATLNAAVVLPVDGEVETPLTDMLESVAVAALDATGETKATVPTKAGLYYWLAGATEVGAENYTNGTARLGDGTAMQLAKPTLDGENGKAFYKVCVGIAEPQSQQ